MNIDYGVAESLRSKIAPGRGEERAMARTSTFAALGAFVSRLTGTCDVLFCTSIVSVTVCAVVIHAQFLLLQES